MREQRLPEKTKIGPLLGRAPKASDYSDLIENDTVLTHGGDPFLLYIKIPERVYSKFLKLTKITKPTNDYRTGHALPTRSSVIGVMPRSPIRCDYCRFTNESKTNPEAFYLAAELNEEVCKIYNAYFPKAFSNAVNEIKQKINQDWRYVDSPYLTCNVNYNHAIPYHRDSANIGSALSNITIIKHGTDGGELVLPEYKLALKQQDGAFTLLHGQSVLHGVMPIRKTKENGFRASIVFYTLSGMFNCLDKQGEMLRFKQTRTTKESLSCAEQRGKLKPQLMAKGKKQ